MKKLYCLTLFLLGLGLGLSPGIGHAQTNNLGVNTTTPGSTLTVNGSVAAAYTVVSTATYTVGATDYYVVWNPDISVITTGTFTLPAGTVGAKGRIYFVKNTSATQSLTVNPVSASETIDGTATVVLGPGEVAQIVSQGTVSPGSTYEVAYFGTGTVTGSAPTKPWVTTGNVGTSAATNFIGTSDAVDLVVKTNSVEHLRVTSAGTVGIGTATPNSAAMLEISATNQGILFPRVALTGTTTWSLAGTPTDAIVVFNTTTVGGTNAITPGYYYWLTNQWYAFNQTTAPTVYGTATFSCANAGVNVTPAALTFTNGQVYSGTISLPYTAGNGGTFTADVVTQSGLTFSHPAGTLSSGAGNIVYSVSGTYIGSTGSTESVPLNLPGSQCAVNLPQLATYAAASLNCQPATAATGTYVLGTSVNAANTKGITVTPATAGAYSISTNTVSGVSFASTGAFNAGQVGTAQPVTLRANGTPTALGAQTYTVTAGNQTCTFAATNTSTAVFACGSATKTQSPTGSLVSGTGYTGTYTIPYTSGNGGTYGSTSQIISGLTLTRVAGTYNGAGGNIVYNLTGTYSGTTAAGAVVFSVVECDKVIYGDVLRGSLAIVGCTSCAAYDAAAVNSWVSVTPAEYAAISNATYVASSKVGGTDALMALPGAYAGSYPYTTGGTTTHVTIPASSYLIGFTLKHFSTVTVVGAKIKVGTAVASGYSMYGNILPNYAAIYGGTNYFVAKRPNVITPAATTYLGFYTPNAYTSCAGPGNCSYSYGDVPTLGTTAAYPEQYQAIRTGTPQW